VAPQPTQTIVAQSDLHSAREASEASSEKAAQSLSDIVFDQQALRHDSSDSTSPTKQHSSHGAGWFQRAAQQPRRYVVAAGLLCLVLAAAAGLAWWSHARNYESTSDAFIDARVVPISSQIAGEIVDLAVTDNQLVAAGSKLYRIDRRNYRAALDLAKAKVEQADAAISNLNAQIAEQQARCDQADKRAAEAKAAVTFSTEQNARAQDLVKKGFGTLERSQQTKSQLTENQALLDAAEAKQTVEEKQIQVLETQQEVTRAQRAQAAAQVELAEANLSRTDINAPEAGWATKITGAKGSYAQPGQTLMLLVPRDVWVTANFKETQLQDMRIGQPVDVWIDAYPGRYFKGHVASIQAGSGAAFSLLPPENATGNYVKVVQRVPVKIVFDEAPDVYIGPGMSVEPYVKVQ
jgi:membrane fusion protein (multidrug efflux system)